MSFINVIITNFLYIENSQHNKYSNIIDDVIYIYIYICPFFTVAITASLHSHSILIPVTSQTLSLIHSM